MVVLSMASLEQIPLPEAINHGSFFSGIPIVDLSDPSSGAHLVRACEDLGFFKVTNHSIPMDLITRLEGHALDFFSLPQSQKETLSHPNPSVYGSRKIGPNGDVGWLEYLLFNLTSPTSIHLLTDPSAISFRLALDEYTVAVRGLACQVLEVMAKGLGIGEGDILSKLVMAEESDCMMRLNHYPPCSQIQEPDCSLTGFGEHTDPQILSVLRSNNTSGLEISLRDGSWVSVPPDQNAFFINVGDSLQVLTNGRFRSVKHRVLANSVKARVSMIFFGGPPHTERLAPLPLLMGEGEQSQYREFAWCEYKTSACGSRLADNRLQAFEKKERRLLTHGSDVFTLPSSADGLMQWDVCRPRERMEQLENSLLLALPFWRE